MSPAAAVYLVLSSLLNIVIISRVHLHYVYEHTFGICFWTSVCVTLTIIFVKSKAICIFIRIYFIIIVLIGDIIHKFTFLTCWVQAIK